MPNKALHTNRRPALGFGLSGGLSDAGRPDHVIVRAAVGELVRQIHRPRVMQPQIKFNDAWESIPLAAVDQDGTGSDHDKLLKAEQLTRVGPSFLVLTGDFPASFLAAKDFRFVHAKG